tara:strand:+ start:140 stop:307 length:168 start_codon:yes stop_codon:yes gene_type:complete
MKKPNVKSLCGKPKAGRKAMKKSKRSKAMKKPSTSNRADSRKRASVYGQWAKGNL